MPTITARTVTADGVTVTTYDDGIEIRSAAEGSAEAMAASCGANDLCFWTKENYKGTNFDRREDAFPLPPSSRRSIPAG